MIGKIHAKLQLVLNDPEPNEVQSLYILALVRKVLEAEDQKNTYPLLRFFCDWALHYWIDNTRDVEDEINSLIGGRADKILDLGNRFYKQFSEFLSHNHFDTKIVPTKFIFTVLNVCAYSPLVVESSEREKKVKITLFENEQLSGMRGSYSWSVQIEDFDDTRVRRGR